DQRRPSENDPQPNPPAKKSNIHRIPHIPVKSDHHQFLWRSDGRGRSMPGPPKIPDATQGHGETNHSRYCGNPPPAGSRCAHAKPKQRRQQPEPQTEESGADQKRKNRAEPRGQEGMGSIGRGGGHGSLLWQEYESEVARCKEPAASKREATIWKIGKSGGCVCCRCRLWVRTTNVVRSERGRRAGPRMESWRVQSARR